MGETGVGDVYLEQLYTFDAPSGPSAARATVAYFALVDAERVRLEARSSWQPAWFPVAEPPDLAFENGSIVSYARRRLQAKLGYSNVVYSLLPERFTLTQLQQVHEAVLGRALDKRNFRKRILSMDFLEATAEVQQLRAHRPARLYRFSRPEPIIF